MSDYCQIGPISINAPHLVDGDSYKTTEEEFEVYCTHWQYKQLLSLIDEGFNSQGAMGVTILNGNNPWSPVYIDSSLLISDNDYLKHKGWYIVSGVEISDIYLNKHLKAKITVTKVSSLQGEMLTMDYTTGATDGTTLDSTYSNTIINTLLNDPFTTFDTSNTWTTLQTYRMTSETATANGNLNFSGHATTLNTWGSAWTQTQNKYTGTFVLETDLINLIKSASGHPLHMISLFISPTLFSSGADLQKRKDTLRLDLSANSSSYSFMCKRISSLGIATTLIPSTVTSLTSLPIRITFTSIRDITIELDLGSGYVTKYNGPSGLTSNSVYIGFSHETLDTTTYTVSADAINIYNYINQTYNNIVGLPAGATPFVDADFTRPSSDGDISCYTNPTEQLPFVCTDPYLGSVKAYTNNNPDNVYRQMFSLDEIPTPTGFNVTNGLVKLVTTSTGVTFQYYNGTSWATLNTFILGTLTYLKLLDIGPMSVTFQANTTKWTLKHNSPYITVEHPNDPLTFTLKDTYDHDSTTTTSPSANADITMEDISHAEIYNSTDTYRMQIYKLDPCTIKSDSIPASTRTGIGFYDSTLASSSYNSKDKLPLEFPVQTDQHISIKQV